MFAAMATGILGGIVVASWVGVLIYNHAVRTTQQWSRRRLQIAKGILGVVVAVAALPSFFLAFVVGGNLGGAIAEALGLGAAGVAVGLALGLAGVFVAAQTVALLLGLLLATGVSRLAA